MEIEFVLEGIVMQPTSLCNLNCTYCYLAARNKNLRMPKVVAARVAEGLAVMDREVEVLWHGGEPLSCGRKHFEALLDPFEDLENAGKVTHAIQTNATLINEEWCKLFQSRRIEIGVSIDGPPHLTKNRIDWAGKAAYERILHGINQLREKGIPFTTICVVTNEGLERAADLYDFFLRLGCTSVGFNIEEKIGVHQNSATDDPKPVLKFWAELFQAWRANPAIKVRELSQFLHWAHSVCNSDEDSDQPAHYYDIFPTVGYNGDVVFLAPELLGAHSKQYDDFVIGNVLRTPLSQLIQQCSSTHYVGDFVRGLRRCAQVCEHFDHCKGGQAGNKFFELGTMNGTETVHCRNTEIRLAEAILYAL